MHSFYFLQQKLNMPSRSHILHCHLLSAQYHCIVLVKERNKITQYKCRKNIGIYVCCIGWFTELETKLQTNLI